MTAAPVVLLDPDDPLVVSDPYPTYHRLRAHAPVHRSDLGYWVVARHRDVVTVLRDPRFGRLPLVGRPTPDDPWMRAAERLLLNLDPPDHTRLRAQVAADFKPSAMAVFRPGVERAVAAVLSAALSGPTFDVVADVAAPIPTAVIGDLLGVPLEVRGRLVELTQRFVGYDPELRPLDDDESAAMHGFMSDVIRFAAELRDLRSVEPGEDLFSRLLPPCAAGELSDDELLAMFAMLFMAGHETTVGLIGNGMLALARHPDQWERLRRQPELVPSAVEECLRFDSPLQATSRIARESVELAGCEIPAGDRVVVLLGSANRDPEAVPDPERFDVGRKPNRHIAFGFGVHFCLGAPLARLEAEVLLGALVEQLPRLELVSEPRWRPTLGMRGLEHLEFAGVGT